MTFNYQFWRYIGHMMGAFKGRRIVYAVVNVVLMGLSALACWGVVASWNAMFEVNFFAGLLGLIFCVAAAIMCFVNGVVAQLIMLVASGIGIANPEERKYNIAAFIIALLSLVALVVAIALLI